MCTSLLQSYLFSIVTLADFATAVAAVGILVLEQSEHNTASASWLILNFTEVMHASTGSEWQVASYSACCAEVLLFRVL